jgi:hypothetical protein
MKTTGTVLASLPTLSTCGDLEEYVGCKIVRMENSLKFTQPVLLQSYSNKFELPTKCYKTPAQVESVLVAGEKDEHLNLASKTKYCSGTGKAMHAIQCSKSEAYNAVQDLSCHMHRAIQKHYKAVYLSTVWIWQNKA